MGLGTLSIQPSIETPFITRKDWSRHRARADVFNVPESSSPSESSRQRRVPALPQPPESHSNDVNMPDVEEDNAGSPYVQPPPSAAIDEANASQDDTPKPAPSSSKQTPK
jgi:hypothetical protein